MLPTVAGRNLANQLGKDSLSHYLQRVFSTIQTVVGNGISEPSTVPTTFAPIRTWNIGWIDLSLAETKPPMTSIEITSKKEAKGPWPPLGNTLIKVKLLVGPTCKIPRSTQRSCSGIRRSPDRCAKGRGVFRLSSAARESRDVRPPGKKFLAISKIARNPPVTLPETNLLRPWKLMVGRWRFLLGFRDYLSFREGNRAFSLKALLLLDVKVLVRWGVPQWAF